MSSPTTVPAYAGVPVVQSIPTNIVPMLSPTSDAKACFVDQRLSGKLQAFMVSYVNFISSNYPVYSL